MIEYLSDFMFLLHEHKISNVMIYDHKLKCMPCIFVLIVGASNLLW